METTYDIKPCNLRAQDLFIVQILFVVLSSFITNNENFMSKVALSYCFFFFVFFFCFFVTNKK